MFLVQAPSCNPLAPFPLASLVRGAYAPYHASQNMGLCSPLHPFCDTPALPWPALPCPALAIPIPLPPALISSVGHKTPQAGAVRMWQTSQVSSQPRNTIQSAGCMQFARQSGLYFWNVYTTSMLSVVVLCQRIAGVI